MKGKEITHMKMNWVYTAKEVQEKLEKIKKHKD